MQKKNIVICCPYLFELILMKITEFEKKNTLNFDST